jgi:hypothetical protein
MRSLTRIASLNNRVCEQDHSLTYSCSRHVRAWIDTADRRRIVAQPAHGFLDSGVRRVRVGMQANSLLEIMEARA